MRNRHVQSTGKQDEVLLDENLVECKLLYQCINIYYKLTNTHSNIPITSFHSHTLQRNITQLTSQRHVVPWQQQCYGLLPTCRHR